MATVCPECFRSVALAGPEAPRFCVYCGHRLVAAPAELGGDTLAFLPDPSGSAASSPDLAVVVPSGGRAPKVPAPPPDARVAGYTILRFLGAGGMGTVYEAEASGSGRRVAVKILSSKLSANPASVERFRQEGRVASQISHPRCVFVLGADTDAGRPFIVMELMPGKTLKDLVDDRGPLPVPAAVERILDVIDGLAEAHRQGVIHRDVKPSNCFLTSDDRVKIGDFGLSKSLTEHEDDSDADGTRDHTPRNLTTSGAFLGTVMYASPEQIRGEPVGYDSDVYAVCATLYFLLTARAPFQHESLTASLARAVSEDAPAIRPGRPDVPRELERVVRRGLDRDRTRRWPTLEALRDALAGLRPEAQRPAGLGAIMLAYVADTAAVQVLIVPLEIGRAALGLGGSAPALTAIVAPFAVSFLYFALFEGLHGATPGKRLLRLRVVRLGELGPPGLKTAAARAGAFHLIWLAISTLTTLGTPVGVPLPGPARVALGVAGLGLLCVQFRRTPAGWRGVHDRASGCAVVERAPPPYRPILRSRYADALDLAKPAAGPAAIGGFAVAGKLSSLSDGSEVWLADDKSLGRRVLVHVRPAGAPDPDPPAAELTRPTRLRVIGRGHVAWPVGPNGKVELRGYAATVAPAGAPLLDLSGPDRPLTWAETRPVLEQLVDELATAATDGTGIPAGVAQVWVEPNGRPQLLDFPLPRARAGVYITPPAAPLDLVRQVATLALEGTARTTGGRVRAAIPLHASRITDGLFDPKEPYERLEDLREDLAADANRPAVVTPGLRRTHLGLFVPLAAAGLVFMAVFGGFLNFALAAGQDRDSRELTTLAEVMSDPAARADLVARARGARGPDTLVERWAGPDRAERAVAQLRAAARLRQEAEELFRSRLNRPERAVFRRVHPDDADPPPAGPYPVGLAEQKLRTMNAPRPQVDDARRFGLIVCGVGVLTPPAVWVVLAFVLRGGFALSVAGIAHVRADGCRAGRFRVAVREALVWLPLTAGLLAAVWVQALYPDWIAVRTTVWVAAVGLLPVYVIVALRYPARPPQDRLLGMVLVPR